MFYFSLFSKSKATENPSECIHGVSLLHKELIITQTQTYSGRPGRECHWCLKQRSVYTQNVLGRRRPVSIFYLKLFSISGNSDRE